MGFLDKRIVGKDCNCSSRLQFIGYRAERGDGPGGRGLGGVLAEPLLAVVHHGGDLRQVRPVLEVGQLGHSFGPKTLRGSSEWTRGRIRVLSGDVPGAGQVPGGDCRADDLGWVQAGEFGGVQGAEQPSGLVGERLAAAGRERGRDELAVAVVAGGLGFGGPDRVQDGEVVGVGQVTLPDYGGGQLGAVAA